MSLKQPFAVNVISSASEQTLNLLWIEISSPTGDFVVGYGHKPLISLISPKSRITYETQENTMASFDVLGGLITISQNGINIFLFETKAPRDNLDVQNGKS